MKYLIISLLLLIGCWQGNTLHAQATETTRQHNQRQLAPSRLDKESWARITKGVSYEPNKPKEKPDINFPDIDLPQIDPPPASAFAVFGKILLWGLVILVVAFIAFRVATMGWGSNKTVDRKGEFSLEHIEENLMESDLDRFLREAIAKNDYKAAVRLYFLSIIKEMALKEMIHWKKDKTNGHYLSELYKKPLYEPFRNIVRIFEYAWYSEMNFEQQHYNQVQPEFKSFLSQVSK